MREQFDGEDDAEFVPWLGRPEATSISHDEGHDEEGGPEEDTDRRQYLRMLAAIAALGPMELQVLLSERQRQELLGVASDACQSVASGPPQGAQGSAMQPERRPAASTPKPMQPVANAGVGRGSAGVGGTGRLASLCQAAPEMAASQEVPAVGRIASPHPRSPRAPAELSTSLRWPGAAAEAGQPQAAPLAGHGVRPLSRATLGPNFRPMPPQALSQAPPARGQGVLFSGKVDDVQAPVPEGTNDVHGQYARWRLRYGEAQKFLYL